MTNKIAVIILSLAIATMYNACGKETFGVAPQVSKDTGDNSSRIEVNEDPTNSKALAECSVNLNSQDEFKIQISAYRDQFGSIDPSLVHAKISKMPRAFDSEKLDIKFFKWSSSPTGETNLVREPVSYRFERKVSSNAFKVVAENYNYTVFNVDEVEKMAKYLKYPATDSFYFFNNTYLLLDLKDPKASFQVIKAALYSGDTVVKQIDILIPTFIADPDFYTKKKPAVLAGLHPLNGLLGKGFTDQQLKDTSGTLCF
jgi:hypothetical protein